MFFGHRNNSARRAYRCNPRRWSLEFPRVLTVKKIMSFALQSLVKNLVGTFGKETLSTPQPYRKEAKSYPLAIWLWGAEISLPNVKESRLKAFTKCKGVLRYLYQI